MWPISLKFREEVPSEILSPVHLQHADWPRIVSWVVSGTEVDDGGCAMGSVRKGRWWAAEVHRVVVGVASPLNPAFWSPDSGQCCMFALRRLCQPACPQDPPRSHGLQRSAATIEPNPVPKACCSSDGFDPIQPGAKRIFRRGVGLLQLSSSDVRPCRKDRTPT